jgi:hypothetical protein
MHAKQHEFKNRRCQPQRTQRSGTKPLTTEDTKEHKGSEIQPTAEAAEIAELRREFLGGFGAIKICENTISKHPRETSRLWGLLSSDILRLFGTLF